MYRNGLTYNSHFINLNDPGDIKRELSSIGVEQESIEELMDRFLYCSLRLEHIDTRAANLMNSYLNSLGGTLAMHKDAQDYTRSKTDVVVSGSRKVFRELAERLKGEPFDLDKIASDIERSLVARNRIITWGRRTLDFNRKTYIMGILNCTPDSFYPESRVSGIEAALKGARRMISSGVDIIDIGGESTRPGSNGVSAKEELERVIPIIKAIRKESDVIISIDTRKREVAEQALNEGADMVNDISGLKRNRKLAELVAERGVPIILMHMQGEPKTMQANPFYSNTISDILKDLQASISFALNAGISKQHIIIDPGIGFGKRIKDNLRIIKELKAFQSLNFPILIGISRKSFIGQILNQPVEGRLIGTITANTLAVVNGADVLRVHDVSDAVEMVKIIESIGQLSV
jgi:dihydropteroate synthase